MSLGQPLCCVVVVNCCGDMRPVEEARGPRGVDVPCCKKCAVGVPHETDVPSDPQAPRPKCECAAKHAHLTQVAEETVALDAGLCALPITHDAVAPVPVTALVTVTAGHSPPRAGPALTLPLLL